MTAYCSQSWPLAVFVYQVMFNTESFCKSFNVLFNSFIWLNIIAHRITNSDETSTSPSITHTIPGKQV